MISRPFQLLTRNESRKGYGLVADKLVAMILRKVHLLNTASDSGSASELCDDGVDDILDILDDEDLTLSHETWELEEWDREESTEDEDWGGEGDDDDDDVDHEGSDNDDYEWDEGEHRNENKASPNAPALLTKHMATHEYPLSLSREILAAARRLLSTLESSSSAKHDLLRDYKSLVLTLFTSQAGNAATHRFESPLEAFFIAMGLTSEGGFRNATQMSNLFSKVQYLCLFSVLDATALSGKDHVRYVYNHYHPFISLTYKLLVHLKRSKNGLMSQLLHHSPPYDDTNSCHIWKCATMLHHPLSNLTRDLDQTLPTVASLCLSHQ